MDKEKSFTFLSYNLNLTEKDEDKIFNFLELVKEMNLSQTICGDVDIIALQGIPLQFFEKIGREMGYLGYKKYFSENFQSRQLGEIIFSKIPVITSKFIEFQKNINHKGLFLLYLNLSGDEVESKKDVSNIKNISQNIPNKKKVENKNIDIKNNKDIKNNSKKLWIGTAHIDQPPYLRSYQLQSINKIVENIPEDIIIGLSTNLLEYDNVTTTIEGWYDAWYESGNDEEKYTYNSETNPLTPYPFKDRPDRVLYRKSDDIECKTFYLVGNKFKLDISSHYGVVCTFKNTFL